MNKIRELNKRRDIHVHGEEDSILARCQFFQTLFIDSMRSKYKFQQVIFVDIIKLILKLISKGKRLNTVSKEKKKV